MLRSSTSKQEVVHLVLALLTTQGQGYTTGAELQKLLALTQGQGQGYTHLEVDQVHLPLAEGREQRVRDVHRKVGADGLLGLSGQGEGHGQGQGQG